MRRDGLTMKIERNKVTGKWDATYPDCSTRSFDERFDEDQAWSVARHWFIDPDAKWSDAFYENVVTC